MRRLGVVPNNLLFFADTEITCPVCGGRRFGEKVLSVRWNGKNISDILSLSVEEAMEIVCRRTQVGGAAAHVVRCGVGLFGVGANAHDIVRRRSSV